MAPVGEAAIATSPATVPEPRKLRVGLFCAGALQPRWVARAFARIAASDFAEVSLIACAPEGRRGAAESLAWRLYRGVDRATFARGPDPGAPVELASAVPHRRLIAWQPGQPVGVELDVAFALGDLDEAYLCHLARHGAWRFAFGEGNEHGEALAGLAEVASAAPLTRSAVLVRLAPDAPARIAYQSWSRTYPFSVARNRAQLLEKTEAFALRALRELHRTGPSWLERCRAVDKPKRADVPPGPRGLSPIVGRILQRGLEKALHIEQWFLAYRLREERFGDGRSVPADLRGFTRLMPPKDRYWADPFVLERGGRYFVFFEELLFRKGKAHISMLEIDAAGNASRPVRVLERDYHLSYPFLLEDGGNLYMIPESAQGGTVELYRCVDFPRTWKLERVLLSGVRCVDATLVRHADRWWMFANVGSERSAVFDDELHVFYADRLLGDWRAHPANPVKSDVRGSRPAGQLFWKGGSLYRPAQICTPLYGAGLAINRVVRLTPTEYAERQVERMLPARAEGLLGLHTLNRAGDLTVVDAFTRRRRL